MPSRLGLPLFLLRGAGTQIERFQRQRVGCSLFAEQAQADSRYRFRCRVPQTLGQQDDRIGQ